MKTLPLLSKAILFASVLFFTSCDNMTVSTGDGSEKVVGSGKLGSEVREIASFNQIKIEGVFNVFLSQKDKESIRVEADENILPLVLVSVENNVLTVKLKENTSISKMKKINVYISCVDINSLKSEGVGMLNCENQLKLNSLELNVSGVGASRLNLEVGTLNIKSDLVGALFVTGTAKEVTAKQNGIGAFEAFDLKAEKLSLETNGVGKVEVFASTEITIDAHGVGGIKYKGNPATKNIKSEGLGSVECVN